MQIIVTATIEFSTPEGRDAAVEGTKHIQQATRDGEPGCLEYAFCPDPCRDNVVIVYELWNDTASLAAHFDHPNYHQMRAALGEFGIANATSAKWETGRSEPVYDATGTARADFESS